MYSSHSKEAGHSRTAKVGVIITNLGSPSAPTKKALRRYLAEFLEDPRVVEVPRAIWWLILNLVILNIRPARSAKAYSKVWTEKGSPLLSLTQDLTTQLASQLRGLDKHEHLIVDFAMRYGEPSIEKTIHDMQAQGVQRLIVLPLYPQYSASTTASTFDEFARVLSHLRWQPSLDFLPPYYDHPSYINSIASSISDYRQQHGTGELLIFSYHGIPMRYLHQGDPYHCQCLKTSRLVKQQLQLNDDQAHTYFQSRFGREPWLQPYMMPTLESLAKQGYKNIDIICPGFSIDCLETLEEVQMEARQAFVDAGGESLNYIPCLNASEAHISMLEQLILPHLKIHLDHIHKPEKKLLSASAIEAIEAQSPNKISAKKTEQAQPTEMQSTPTKPTPTEPTPKQEASTQ